MHLLKDVKEPIIFRHFHDPLFHDQNPHIPAKPLKWFLCIWRQYNQGVQHGNSRYGSQLPPPYVAQQNYNHHHYPAANHLHAACQPQVSVCVYFMILWSGTISFVSKYMNYSWVCSLYSRLLPVSSQVSHYFTFWFWVLGLHWQSECNAEVKCKRNDFHDQKLRDLAANTQSQICWLKSF